MIAFPTDKGGAAIRPHDDTLDRELSYRMQQISKKRIVSPSAARNVRNITCKFAVGLL